MALPYKNSRKSAGYKAEEAAGQLHMDKRSLYRIEAGEQPAPPDMVWNMARLYQDPHIIRWYQSEVDPIGRRINPPELAGIVNSPQVVHYKLAGEMEEAVPAAAELCRLIINKVTACDFTEQEVRQYFALYGKSVSNVKQAIAEVEGALMRIFGVEALEVAGRAHRERMLVKGYLVKKEKAPLGAIPKISYDSLSLSDWQVKEPVYIYH